MTNVTPGRGRRVLLIDPAAQAARGDSEGRLGRLLIAGALASFLGFFGLAMISTPPDSTNAGSQPAISAAPSFTRGDGDDDDDDGWFSTGSDVRTRTS